MKRPDTPLNEAKRLAALHALEVLDTHSEERFDRLTRFARQRFGVPIALVSLIDAERQWFKSCVGLDVSETSREISFCGHAILDDQLFVIDDTLKDSRFADNPLVTGPPGIRFYAGCPLSHADGSKLGTLCLIDSEPRSLNVEQQQALRELGLMAERELEAVQYATLDELTGMSNRTGFGMLVNLMLKPDFESEIAITMVYFEISNLSEIVDLGGSDSRDGAIRRFSDLLLRAFPDGDVLARIGPNRFAVILSGHRAPRAEKMLLRLTAALEGMPEPEFLGPDVEFAVIVVPVDADTDRSVGELVCRAEKMIGH